jgi:DNA-binding transcriptional LysR family regulator
VRFVTPVVTDFLARYSEASVDLRTGPTMIDLVQEAFDLGISPFPPPDATLVRRRLGMLGLMVCGAPAYLENIQRRTPRPTWPATTACATPTYRLRTSGILWMRGATRSWRAYRET